MENILIKSGKTSKIFVDPPRKGLDSTTIENILKMEKDGEIFVIRPSKKINIKLIERNPNKLQEIYDLGIKDSNNIINDLKKYLELN